MIEAVAAIAFALFTWWFSTGIILYLVRLPRHTYPISMSAATLLLALSLYGFVSVRSETGTAGAYLGFSCAIAVWAWLEMSFLFGYVTGWKRSAGTEPPASGLSRFGRAAGAILYHEIAIAAAGSVILALSWDAANKIGLWTFCVLWFMRLSAKLNLFLGVPNPGEELLPDHLQFLGAYFRKAPINLFFPVAVTAATIFLTVAVQKASAWDASPFDSAGWTLVAALLALAIVEHWFLVLPIPAIAPWRFILQAQAARPSRIANHFATAEAAVKSCVRPEQGEQNDRNKTESGDIQAWSAQIPGNRHPRDLRALLKAVAGGAFGDVQTIEGLTRSNAGWVQFNVTQGRFSVSKCRAKQEREARMNATGKKLDRARLLEAFDACASPKTGGVCP